MVMTTVAVMAAAIISLSYLYWNELKGPDSAGATVRNIGLVGGGLIAIVLALWRSAIAQRQAEVAEQDSLDGQFQKAASMLGHEDLFVRIGGVTVLYYLGCNHLDRYGFQVCTILGEFRDLKQTYHDEKFQVSIERVIFGGKIVKYRGPHDGGQAFEAFWDLQMRLNQHSKNKNKIWRNAKRMFQRLLSWVRRQFG